MLKKLALSLVAVLLSLLAAEVLLRVTGAAPKVYAIQKGRFRLSANPRIGYEPAPTDYRGKNLSFYDYLGASNREGFRDVDHAVAKPPGVYRIVVLGDSIAAGLHVERNEDVFAPILEKLLNDRWGQGVKAEVINLAVSGYNTQQEVELFREKGLRYRPDLVLLAYSLSSREHVDGDILKTLLDEERQKGGAAARLAANPVLVRSALYRFLRFRVFHPHAQHVADRQSEEEEEQKLLAAVSGDTVAEYFGVLRDLSQKNGFEVLVAVFPRFVRTFNYYKFAAQHRFAQEQAQKNGFYFVDLLEPFARCRNASPATPIELDNFHPSAHGHRCAAEALAGVILGEIRSGR